MEEPSKKANIEIFYEKTPLYRTIYSDGLIGGLTPTGSINLSFYATRNPIPKSITHEIAPNGIVDPKGVKSEDSKSGIIREVEVGIYMNRKTAKDIYEFLKKIIESDGK